MKIPSIKKRSTNFSSLLTWISYPPSRPQLGHYFLLMVFLKDTFFLDEIHGRSMFVIRSSSLGYHTGAASRKCPLKTATVRRAAQITLRRRASKRSSCCRGVSKANLSALERKKKRGMHAYTQLQQGSNAGRRRPQQQPAIFRHDSNFLAARSLTRSRCWLLRYSK